MNTTSRLTKIRITIGSIVCLSSVAMLVALSQWAPSPAQAATPATATATQTPPADDDHDGIPDNLEQKLAEMYAPLMYIEADESNYPVNVDWMLARARLHYHEDCRFSGDDDVGPVPIASHLLGPDPNNYWGHTQSCGSDDSGYEHPPHRLITPVAPDPDGLYSVGAQTTGYADQQTFELKDLPDSQHIGSTDPRDWVTYFHAYPTRSGGIMIQYWHVFAYNEFGGGGDNHGGDWDASIQVELDKNLEIAGVWFSRHLDDHPGKFFPKSDNLVRFFNNTHPVVTVDGGGHAAFRSPDDWMGCNCRFAEAVTGVLGTIVWTDDAAPYDNPYSLRRVIITADVDANGHPVLPFHTALSLSVGGVVWKTWSDGNVTAAGSLTHPIVAPSAHGGLINLGEYNPCTETSCYKTVQAAPLLSGQFYPLNNNFWLIYSGRWGSTGQFNSGPRGPVFQGFINNGEGNLSVYSAWYNQGADSPASNSIAGQYPWLTAPTTTATIGSPSYLSGNVTFVAGNTNITLSASQAGVAAQYGSTATYYRFFQSGGVAPGFNVYTGPFQLHGAGIASDGVCKIQYYSVDGLGNIEATKTLTVTLDNSAPVSTINQPAAIQYPHSTVLTLGYSVSDGAGSGLTSFTPKMDGATNLADGRGLQSGPPAIDFLTEMTLGNHTFSVTATDNLGNTGTSSVVFAIIVTADSIQRDVTQFLQNGKIKNSGEANSLLAKLDAAAKARAAGKCATANSNYQAFINELQAQRGKDVDAIAAAIMIADAQYLMAHCP